MVAFGSSDVESLVFVIQATLRICFMEQKCCRELCLVNMVNKPLSELIFYSCEISELIFSTVIEIMTINSPSWHVGMVLTIISLASMIMLISFILFRTVLFSFLHTFWEALTLWGQTFPEGFLILLRYTTSLQRPQLWHMTVLLCAKLWHKQNFCYIQQKAT